MADGKSPPSARNRDIVLKLEEFLPHRLNVVSSLVSHALSSIYTKQHNIGVPEWRILVTLGQYGEMTGKALGAHTHMHKTKVSRAAAALEKRRFVTRKANRDDRREALLSLTSTGRGIYDKLVPIALNFAQELLATLDPADRAAFDRTLRILTERSQKYSTQTADK